MAAGAVLRIQSCAVVSNHIECRFRPKVMVVQGPIRVIIVSLADHAVGGGPRCYCRAMRAGFTVGMHLVVHTVQIGDFQGLTDESFHYGGWGIPWIAASACWDVESDHQIDFTSAHRRGAQTTAIWRHRHGNISIQGLYTHHQISGLGTINNVICRFIAIFNCAGRHSSVQAVRPLKAGGWQKRFGVDSEFNIRIGFKFGGNWIDVGAVWLALDPRFAEPLSMSLEMLKFSEQFWNKTAVTAIDAITSIVRTIRFFIDGYPLKSTNFKIPVRHREYLEKCRTLDFRSQSETVLMQRVSGELPGPRTRLAILRGSGIFPTRYQA